MKNTFRWIRLISAVRLLPNVQGIVFPSWRIWSFPERVVRMMEGMFWYIFFDDRLSCQGKAVFLLIVVENNFSSGSEHFRRFLQVAAYAISGPFDQVFILLGLSFSWFALLSM